MDRPPFVLEGDGSASGLAHGFDDLGSLLAKRSEWLEADKRLHLGLVPVPYMGDLSRACVLILQLNPGFEPLTYFEEQQSKPWREALVRNLHQEFNQDEQFPFIGLDPAFAFTSWFRYWEPRFRTHAQAVAHRKGGSYEDGLSFLARNVALVELVPYYSREWKSVPEGVLDQLKSVGLVKRFVGDRAKDCCTLVLRGNGHWRFVNGERTHISANPRGATFSTSTQAGKWLLDKLLG